MTEMELYKLWCEKAVDAAKVIGMLISRQSLNLSRATRLQSRTDFTEISNLAQADSEELSVQAHTDLMFTLSDVQHRVLQTM